MLVAKLPGSMYATHATNAGPRKGNRRAKNPFRLFPSSTRGAELTVVTSPGLTTRKVAPGSCWSASFDGFRLSGLEGIVIDRRRAARGRGRPVGSAGAAR